MTRRLIILSIVTVILALNLLGCARPGANSETLTGAWKGKVQFKTGAYAQIKDLEFMRVFNAGGTMTESSNYDGAPPVPPAYGIWEKTGRDQFEAAYQFYWNSIPSAFDEISKSGGFLPDGYGVVKEKITVSAGGKSYKSTINLMMFDKSGKRIGEDAANAEAERMEL